MINFEKSNNPLKDLDIGKIAVPIRIIDLYTNDKEVASFGSANLSEKDARRVLESISKGELSFGWEDRYFVGKIIENDEEEISESRLKPITFHIIPIRECIGSYIEFRGKKYYIRGSKES